MPSSQVTHGSIHTDSQIAICNTQEVEKCLEIEAVKLWKLSNNMGLVGESSKEKMVDQFAIWKKRDSSEVEAGRKANNSVLEMSVLNNADC